MRAFYSMTCAVIAASVLFFCANAMADAQKITRPAFANLGIDVKAMPVFNTDEYLVEAVVTDLADGSILSMPEFRILSGTENVVTSDFGGFVLVMKINVDQANSVLQFQTTAEEDGVLVFSQRLRVTVDVPAAATGSQAPACSPSRTG